MKQSKRYWAGLMAIILLATAFLTSCTTHDNEYETTTRNNETTTHNKYVETTHSHDWEKATCKKPKTCSTCGATEGSKAAHTFENGKCTVCEEVDKNSDEYKYGLLKKKADALAYSCAETAIRNGLKNPSSMSVLNEETLDSDNYFRYHIKIQYSAMNSLGGTVTETAYVLIRINPKMDGTFFHTQTGSKDDWGWGTEPDDWSLDATDKYTNPAEMSIKMILANPSAYEGQYVKIEKQLFIFKNILSDKKFWAYEITSNGKYNYDNGIYVFYHLCDNMDDLIMLDADYQEITVIGEVKTYADSTEAYIEAYEIIFD